MMEAFFIVTSKVIGRGFPGGLVVEGWPASAGAWVPSQVRKDPTCNRASQPCAPQVLSQCPRAREPELLSPHAAVAEAHVPTA